MRLMFFKQAENKGTYPEILLYHVHTLECFNEKNCLFLNIFLSALPAIWYKSVKTNAKWISKRFFSYLIHYQKKWRKYTS